MKLELKNIKHASFASEETHCFEAVLYVDGKPFATIGNDGHGGCDHVHPYKLTHRDSAERKAWQDNMDKIDVYFASLPKSKLDLGNGQTADIEQSLEIWASEQVNEFLAKRDFKRAIKSKVLAQFKDGIYQWKKAPDLAKQIALIKQKYAAEKVVILKLDEATAFRITSGSASGCSRSPLNCRRNTALQKRRSPR